MSNGHLRQKRLKIILLVTMLLVFGVVITVFIGYRTVSNPQDVLLSTMIEDDATIAIDGVHQISTKDGFKDWSLDAASAHFLEKERQAVFNDLAVTFYMESGGIVALTAQKGYLDTDTRNIRIHGNVVGDDGEFKFKTESLEYEHQRRVLVAPENVEIVGRMFRLNANSAIVDLAAQRTTFKGKVEGTIFGEVL